MCSKDANVNEGCVFRVPLAGLLLLHCSCGLLFLLLCTLHKHCTAGAQCTAWRLQETPAAGTSETGMSHDRCHGTGAAAVMCNYSCCWSAADLPHVCCPQLYEEAWSKPHGVLLLDDIMAEEHEQIDQVWQGNTPGIGRKRMKRGILVYRSAYPDIQ